MEQKYSQTAKKAFALVACARFKMHLIGIELKPQTIRFFLLAAFKTECYNRAMGFQTANIELRKEKIADPLSRRLGNEEGPSEDL